MERELMVAVSKQITGCPKNKFKSIRTDICHKEEYMYNNNHHAYVFFRHDLGLGEMQILGVYSSSSSLCEIILMINNN